MKNKLTAGVLTGIIVAVSFLLIVIFVLAACGVFWNEKSDTFVSDDDRPHMESMDNVDVSDGIPIPKLEQHNTAGEVDTLVDARISDGMLAYELSLTETEGYYVTLDSVSLNLYKGASLIKTLELKTNDEVSIGPFKTIQINETANASGADAAVFVTTWHDREGVSGYSYCACGFNEYYD